ncbi:DUF2207 domain-containing protein [Affinibrenneria salicis]|uniref:DUF2207 domain-containing protein n=1 Tax=Affinibrenneria salicis TaxID=2590031 RepID=A0A5J5FT60_9GAMM|nr:DUF2207 domain-containing protein [Affinibrenneria salicis]KAA8996672.1 DUF2207 domain-containing protein [Affinibrenneria salicis]
MLPPLPAVCASRRFFRRYRLCLTLLLGLLAPGIGHANIQFIYNYAVRIDIQDDGRVLVTESLLIDNQGYGHGLTRTLPRDWLDADGSLRQIDYHLLDITRDGQPEKYFEISYGHSLTWNIGNADRLLSDGPHQYVIRYEAIGARLRLARRDELLWNVVGNGWPFVIRQASFQLHLPQEKEHRGANGWDNRVTLISATVGPTQQPALLGAEGVISAPGPLAPHQGFRVHLAWPDSALAPLSMRNIKAWLFARMPMIQVAWHGLWPERDTLYLWLPFGLLLIYALIYLPRRNPTPRVFRPPLNRNPLPPEVTPGLVSLVTNRHIEYRGFAGDLLYLVDRGLLRWEQGSNPFDKQKLVLLPADDASIERLPPAARLLWQSLQQQTDGQIVLGYRYQPVLVAARKTLEEYYWRFCCERLFYNKKKIGLWAMLAAVIPLLCNFFYLSVGDTLATLAQYAFGTTLLSLLFGRLLNRWRARAQEAGRRRPLRAACCRFLPLHGAVALLLALAVSGSLISEMPAGILSAFLAPLYLFAYYHRAQPFYTQQGENLLAQIRGLSEQIADRRAAQRLDRAGAHWPQMVESETPLPYMLALDMQHLATDEQLHQLSGVCRADHDSADYGWQHLTGLNSLVAHASSTTSDRDYGSSDSGSSDCGGSSDSGGGGGGGGGDSW